MSGARTIYCIDTSSILLWFVNTYPPAIFPGLVTRMEELIDAGRLRSPKAVFDERLDPERPFDRGQDQARRHHTSRRRRIAQRTGGRGYHRDPACSARRKAVAWLTQLLKRKSPKLAAVALANKTARIAWKLMITGENYTTKAAPAALAGAS